MKNRLHSITIYIIYLLDHNNQCIMHNNCVILLFAVKINLKVLESYFSFDF